MWLSKRRAFASALNKAFKDVKGLRVILPQDDISHAYYKYYVFVKPSELKEGFTRDRIMQAINEQGVPCFSGSCSEIYLEKAFEKQGLQPKARLDVAKKLGETSLMFLVHPTLTQAHIDQTIEAVLRVMQAAAASWCYD